MITNYQAQYGADPTEDEVFESAFSVFSDPSHVDNSDGRWTSDRGQRDLLRRVRNTLRRLRGGQLAKHGIASIETGEGTEEAEGLRDRKLGAGTSADGGPDTEKAPPAEQRSDSGAGTSDPHPGMIFDPWERYVVPPFPFDILPTGVRRFVETQSVVIGCDPSALAMAALVNFGSALDHRFSLKLMRNGDWRVSPRLWVLLVGDPSTKKTPIIDAALRELEAHENRLRDNYEAQLADYENDLKGLGKDDPKPPAPPKPPRFVTSDATTEKLGEILSRTTAVCS